MKPKCQDETTLARRLADRLAEALKPLHPDERYDILSDLRGPYCDGCGGDRGCQCENDE